MDETKSRPRPRKTSAKTAATKVVPVKAIAAKRPRRASSPAPVDRQAQLRIAAYFRAERRGFAPGFEVEDWLAAEAEVGALETAKQVAKPRKAASRKPRSS